MNKGIGILFLCLIVTGCATVTLPTYTKPNIAPHVKETSVDLDTDYDVAWNKVIKGVARNSYAIKTHEKDSGIITLDFGLGEANRFVDCGYLEAVATNNKGPYIDMVTSRLNGLMNIVVSKIDSQNTNITANIRYLLHIKDGHLEQDWVFDAYGQQTKRIGVVDVTCESTGVAETALMKIISSGN